MPRHCVCSIRIGSVAPAGFGLNGCLLRREVIPDLERLLAAAKGDPAVMGQLRGLSCHRSIIRQARKDATPTAEQVSRGEAPRRGRAWRELFQFIKDAGSSAAA